MPRLLRLLPALLVLVAAPLAAQDSLPAVPDTLAGSPVVVRGDTLFALAVPLGPLSPAERAAGISVRLEALERDPDASGDRFTIERRGDERLIRLGPRSIMSVLPADAAAAGIPIDTLAIRYRTALAAQFAVGSGAFRLRALLEAAAYALLATLVAALLVWLLKRIWARLEGWVERLRGSRHLTIRFQRLELLSADRVVDAARWLLGWLRVVGWVLLGYFYVVVVLSLFPWTRDLSSQILGFVTAPLRQVGRSVADYLPNLFFIALIVLVTRWVLHLIRMLFRAIEHGSIALASFEREWATPTYKLVRVLVLAFALVVLFPYLPGSGSDAFKGVSIFVGVLFSLGSTGAVANLVAGTLLTYTRSFRVGDRVRIGETLGDVVARTLLVTRVRTLTNVEVTIPNSQVMSGQVLNYTTHAADRGVAVQVEITIGYDVPWRRVHELLVAAAAATDGILEEPAPFVLQTGLQDSYPCYQLNAYTRDASRLRFVLSALHQAVQDGFARGGVEITSPAYLAVRRGDAPAIPEVPPAQ